jgi:hypothetical protein
MTSRLMAAQQAWLPEGSCGFAVSPAQLQSSRQREAPQNSRIFLFGNSSSTNAFPRRHSSAYHGPAGMSVRQETPSFKAEMACLVLRPTAALAVLRGMSLMVLEGVTLSGAVSEWHRASFSS